jgi:hypothetical protein
MAPVEIKAAWRKTNESKGDLGMLSRRQLQGFVKPPVI